MDVITAFLNGKLKERIYMEQPPGFAIPGHEDKVCQLNRSLYGLKQSPRQWYEEIDNHLRNSGWTCSELNPNLYFPREGETITSLMLYVDDLLIFGSSKERVAEIKVQLGQKYKMKDLGLVNRYLGIDFVHTTDGKVFLHQNNYTTELLKECNIEPRMVKTIPLLVGLVLEADTHTTSVDISAYCHIVGKLIFLCHTRLDISYTIGIMSHYMHSPQAAHWSALQHILRYLNYTPVLGILIDPSDESTLHGFTDSDYLSCKNTRRSVGSYIFKLAGGPISC